MERSLKALALAALAAVVLAPSAIASTLQGRIVNGTTGEPARVDALEVFDVASTDNEPVARLEDVEGEFSISDLPEAAAAHFRIQVHSGDQVFTQPVESFDTPMEVYVYESTDDTSEVALLRHHVIFTRDPDHMQVTEFLEYQNRTDPPRLIRGSALPMRVALDHEIHGEPTASIMGTPQPSPVELVPGGEPGVFGVSHDLQPGSTRVVVRYLVHEDEAGLAWSTRMLYPTEDRRILVNPPDITVQASDMIPAESSVENYAAWQGLAGVAGEEWTVALTGGSAAGSGMEEDHSTQTTAAAFAEVVARPNRLTESRPMIFLGLGGMLVFGTLGVLLSGRGRATGDGAPDPDRLAVSRVADRYVSGEITREEYEREAARLMKKKSGRHAAPVA